MNDILKSDIRCIVTPNHAQGNRTGARFAARLPMEKRLLLICENRLFEVLCGEAEHLTASRNIQVMGKIGAGETIIWDRKPGVMRLSMIWYDGSDIMPRDVEVEPGKTYYLHYTFRYPKSERWELIEAK